MATARELLEFLEEMQDLSPEALDEEILLATQPSYPFENAVAGFQVIQVGEDTHRLVIAEGNQVGYLSGHVKDELGW